VIQDRQTPVPDVRAPAALNRERAQRWQCGLRGKPRDEGRIAEDGESTSIHFDRHSKRTGGAFIKQTAHRRGRRGTAARGSHSEISRLATIAGEPATSAVSNKEDIHPRTTTDAGDGVEFPVGPPLLRLPGASSMSER